MENQIYYDGFSGNNKNNVLLNKGANVHKFLLNSSLINLETGSSDFNYHYSKMLTHYGHKKDSQQYFNSGQPKHTIDEILGLKGDHCGKSKSKHSLHEMDCNLGHYGQTKRRC